MKKANLVFPLIFSLAIASAACVTVNVPVVFPEATVQRATDDYVRELYRAKERGKTPAPARGAQNETSAWVALLDFSIFPEAQAADGAAFRVDTQKALKIRENLAGQVSEVLTQKRAGVVGETKDGLLAIRDASKLKKLLLQKVEKLVGDENALRKELYAEVASANNIPASRIGSVQESFARSFQAESPSGSWVENDSGSWNQKP